MKKAELVAQIIHKYGVYPPESFSYYDLIRLRTMLEKHGKPKQSFLQAKGKAITETPVFDPPPFKSFKVEEEETVKSSLALSCLDFPVSDEDGTVSPITDRKRIITDATTPIKKKRNE
jgi:hypothetical protein